MTTTHDGTRADGVRPDVADQVRASLRAELQLPATQDLDEGVEFDRLPAADSVRLMRVVADLERIYDVEFDDNAIRDATTIGDLVALVRSVVDSARS